MTYAVLLSPASIEDIDVGFEYYNHQSAGLGFEFVNTIDAFLKKISEVPKASSIRYDNVRVKPVSVFPYTIHYTIDETKQQVIILRIFNTWKEPFWRI